ncbi:hypothetical protein ALC62_04779 [Cyphomyrmex costatus]|uniref:Uncharacterized protein n=1 Tax=Cyphomyrmex costatus TaxID=456900 RepID=A0A195CTM2_9HYME|nr:hypothetical protein ALC62_04779 [Cyphomyrmex costatus]
MCHYRFLLLSFSIIFCSIFLVFDLINLYPSIRFDSLFIVAFKLLRKFPKCSAATGFFTQSVEGKTASNFFCTEVNCSAISLVSDLLTNLFLSLVMVESSTVLLPEFVADSEFVKVELLLVPEFSIVIELESGLSGDLLHVTSELVLFFSPVDSRASLLRKAGGLFESAETVRLTLMFVDFSVGCCLLIATAKGVTEDLAGLIGAH